MVGGKVFYKYTFLVLQKHIFPENRIWYFMQIVSNGVNLHEMSNIVFWEK